MSKAKKSNKEKDLFKEPAGENLKISWSQRWIAGATLQELEQKLQEKDQKISELAQGKQKTLEELKTLRKDHQESLKALNSEKKNY